MLKVRTSVVNGTLDHDHACRALDLPAVSASGLATLTFWAVSPGNLRQNQNLPVWVSPRIISFLGSKNCIEHIPHLIKPIQCRDVDVHAELILPRGDQM
jgi:hypothetical protein